jgi:hypothetical protein
MLTLYNVNATISSNLGEQNNSVLCLNKKTGKAFLSTVFPAGQEGKRG